MIRYASIPLNYDIEGIRREAGKLASGWRDHFNTRDYTGEWTVLPLRSPGGSPEGIIPDLVFETFYADTPFMELFPSVKELLNSIHCEILSARLLNLKIGAVIKPHRDSELSFEKGEARLHFPIITNEDVEFFVDDHRIQMKAGECWYVNANRKHHVSNKGVTDRIHLVVDCKVNGWLKDLFENAGKAMVSDLEQMENWEPVIRALREHKTETSSKLADEMEGKLIAALAQTGSSS